MKKIEQIWPTKVFCPFCNQQIQSIDDEEGNYDYKICEHTIFIAHDEGFEFRTDEVNKLLKINPKTDGLEIEVPDGIPGFDGFTDLIDIEGGVKIATYDDCARPEGIYFGFQPKS